MAQEVAEASTTEPSTGACRSPTTSSNANSTAASGVLKAAATAASIRAPNRSVNTMNATTVAPTSAPISSVTSRNTCSSRCLSSAAHRCDGAHHRLALVCSGFAAIASLSTLFSFRRTFLVIQRWSLFEQFFDGANQLTPVGAQFTDAMPHYLFQQALPAGKQRHQHASPVIAPPRTTHIAVRCQTVDQFHCAVMF